MKLKENLDINAFVEKARGCKGDVFLCSPEGDRLNLKSTLAQYIFAVAAQENQKLLNGWLEIERQEDQESLRDFLAEE